MPAVWHQAAATRAFTAPYDRQLGSRDKRPAAMRFLPVMHRQPKIKSLAPAALKYSTSRQATLEPPFRTPLVLPSLPQPTRMPPHPHDRAPAASPPSPFPPQLQELRPHRALQDVDRQDRRDHQHRQPRARPEGHHPRHPAGLAVRCVAAGPGLLGPCFPAPTGGRRLQAVGWGRGGPRPQGPARPEAGGVWVGGVESGAPAAQRAGRGPPARGAQSANAGAGGCWNTASAALTRALGPLVCAGAAACPP
jgi:hypothetical protein